MKLFVVIVAALVALSSAKPTNEKVKKYRCNPAECRVVSKPSCEEWYELGETEDGLYPLDDAGVPEGYYFGLCDMTTDDGGWTVFQKRSDGGVDFNQVFAAYEAGFGPSGEDSPKDNFWMGLRRIKLITDFYAAVPAPPGPVDVDLRIDATDCADAPFYQKYAKFSLDAAPDYILHLEIPSPSATRHEEDHGDMGDSIIGEDVENPGDQVDMPFKARDTDVGAEVHCSRDIHLGGWWFNDCTNANLNGKWYAGCQATNNYPLSTMFWATKTGYFNGLKTTKIMLRPVRPESREQF